MKAVLQDMKSGTLSVGDVPPPTLQSGGVLVQVTRSVISLGTERSIIALAKKGPIGKAQDRPDLARKVLNRAKQEGLWNTYQVVKNLLASPEDPELPKNLVQKLRLRTGQYIVAQARMKGLKGIIQRVDTVNGAPLDQPTRSPLDGVHVLFVDHSRAERDLFAMRFGADCRRLATVASTDEAIAELKRNGTWAVFTLYLSQTIDTASSKLKPFTVSCWTAPRCCDDCVNADRFGFHVQTEASIRQNNRIFG